MKTSVLFCCLLLLVGCTGGPDDVSVTPFEAGTWSGTFSLIARHEPQPLGSVTQEGIVTFHFSQTTYMYEGQVQSPASPSNPRGPYAIHDVGVFNRDDHVVTLFDQANERMVMWTPSLYLTGPHIYTMRGHTMTITQTTYGRSLTLVLTKQFGG